MEQIVLVFVCGDRFEDAEGGCADLEVVDEGIVAIDCAFCVAADRVVTTHSVLLRRWQDAYASLRSEEVVQRPLLVEFPGVCEGSACIEPTVACAGTERCKGRFTLIVEDVAW